MSVAFQWLHNISFFHAAFEALAVNELRYLQLKEMKVRLLLADQPKNLTDIWSHQYGVELDVPAATILSTFGLRAQVRSHRFFMISADAACTFQSYWWPNISLLGIFFVTFTAASYITLHYYVKEKR